MNKRLTLWGGILWIIGLAASIVGMNIPGNAGHLAAVGGNILFLLGLGITGAAWLSARRQGENKREE